MKLDIHTAPHIRASDTATGMIGSVFLALLPLCLMAYYYYGLRSAAVLALSMGTAYLLDRAAALFRPSRFIPADFSGAVTGLIIGLLLPASVPYWLPVTCAAFAILVVKHPFGGFGSNPFNPAAVAVVFATVCFPQHMGRYPLSMDHLPLTGDVAARLSDSTISILKAGGLPTLDKLEVLLGKFPGPMGATNILVIMTCLLFLLARKTCSWHIPAAFIGFSALSAWLFPRTPVGGLSSVFFELTAGSLIFTAVFVATDPVTSPNTKMGKLFYGAACGVLTMVFRRIGTVAEGSLFAVVLMNALTGFFDRTCYLVSACNWKGAGEFLRGGWEGLTGLLSGLQKREKLAAPQETAEKPADASKSQPAQ